MPLTAVVEPGGEKFLPFTKRKIQFWHQQMLRSGMRVLNRVILVDDGTRIYVKMLSVGKGQFIDKLRITAGSLTVFVVYPHIVRLSDDLVFGSTTQPFALSLARTGISSLGAYDSASAKYRVLDGETWTPVDHGDDGYATGGSFTPVVGALSQLFFKHEYVDSGDQVRVLAVGGALQVSKIVSGALVALSGAHGSTAVFDVSPDGRAAAGLEGDDLTQIAIDYAGVPQVTRSIASESPYGTETTHRDVNYVVGGASNSAEHDYDITTTAQFPVCYGYSADNVLQSIRVDKAFTQSTEASSTQSTSCTLGVGGTYDSSGVLTATGEETQTLVLPNGVSREFTTLDYTVTGSAAYHVDRKVADCAINFATAAYTPSYSWSATTGVLEILYADASLPVVVYRFTQRTYSAAGFIPTVNNFDDEVTTTDTVTVVALIGETEHLIDTYVTVLPPSSGVGDPIATAIPAVLPPFPGSVYQVAGIYGGFSSETSDTTTDVDVDANDMVVQARHQAPPLGVATFDVDRFVVQYARPTDVAVLYPSSAEAAISGYFVRLYEAKENADPPTITASEQELLDALRDELTDEYEFRLLPLGFSTGMSVLHGP